MTLIKYLLKESGESTGITGGQKNRETTLPARIISFLSGNCHQTTAPPQIHSNVSVSVCMCVCIFTALHHPQSMGCPWEECHSRSAMPPGIRARGHDAWCRHMMGVCLLSRCPLTRQLMGGKRCWHKASATGKVGTGDP